MIVSQQDFYDGLLNGSSAIPNGLVDNIGQPAGDRYNVYRNNIAASLIEALKEGFPVVQTLLGIENMNGLANLYFRKHPPTSRLMVHFGHDFPDFLSQMPELSHLGYLPDVARMELEMRRSYHARDSRPMDTQELETLTPEQLFSSAIELAPSLSLIRSSWPLYSIWRFNTEDNAPKPEAIAEDVLILRKEYDPEPLFVSPEGADFITALREGKTIGQSYETALLRSSTFDLTSTFGMLLAGDAIISLNQKGHFHESAHFTA